MARITGRSRARDSSSRRTSRNSSWGRATVPVPQMLQYRGGGLAGGHQRLHQGPEGDPLAVVQAAAAEHRGFVADPGQQLSHQPGLAHARHTQQREQVTAALLHGPVPGPAQQRQLARSSHHHGVEMPGDPRGDRIHPQQPVGRQRLGLALERQRLQRLHLDGVAHELEGVGAQHDLSRLRGLLQARRDVDGIADRHVLPCPLSTGPVFTPVRNRRATPTSCASAGNRSRISAAARTARRASSSWTLGIPNTAITASPMNFSTVPPWRSMIARISEKYRFITPRRTSGSSSSPSAVEPVTSQNTAVTTLRVWRGAGA